MGSGPFLREHIVKIALTHNLQRTDAVEEAEFDSPETIAALTAALERLGHDVVPVEVSLPVEELVATLRSIAPDLIFNTAEGRTGRNREAFYPALFEQMQIPYTASDAYTCTTTLDKQLTKLLVEQAGVPIPRAQLIRSLKTPIDVTLRFPVIVKPNAEGSSRGIDADAVVDTMPALRARVEALLPEFPTGLLLEEYITGLDVVVPFLEVVSPKTGGVLAPACYRIAPEGTAHQRFPIYDYALKHELSDAVSVEVPARFPEDVLSRLNQHAQRAFAALDIRDLGRLDFRITDDGQIFFIEANALPSLEPGASIYESSRLIGLERIEDVLDAVLTSAIARNGITRTPRVPKRPTRVGLIYNLKRVKPTTDGDQDAEFDSEETIAAIAAAIAEGGHEVVRLEANPELLRSLEAARLDVAFNIAEGLRGRGRESLVPALLEMLDIPYTGSDPTTLAVTLDKSLAKHIVRQAGVATPVSTVLTRRSQKLPTQLTLPAVLKPVAEGSSKGVSTTSLVHTEEELRARAGELLERYRQGVLVEQYVGGREFTVGLLGSARRPEVLPPLEIVFTSDAPFHLYTFEHKQSESHEVRYEVPAQVDDALGERLARAARASYRALGCRDVARIDFRLDAEGQPCFIECNPLPGLTPGWSDLCQIATAAHLSYAQLIARILAPALRRMHAQRRGRRHV